MTKILLRKECDPAAFFHSGFPHLLFQMIPRCHESTLLLAQLRAASYGSKEAHHWSPLLSEGVSEVLKHLMNQTQQQHLIAVQQ